MQSRECVYHPGNDEFDARYNEFSASVAAQIDPLMGLADIAERTCTESDAIAYRRAGHAIALQLDVASGLQAIYHRSRVPERPLESYATLADDTVESTALDTTGESVDNSTSNLGATPRTATVYAVTTVPYREQAIAELVTAAQGSDPRAFKEIFERHARDVEHVVDSYRLGEADAADAVASTWLRTVEALPAIREPDRLGGWLRVTARRECLRILRAESREVPCDDPASTIPSRTPGPEEIVIAGEVSKALGEALASLGGRSRQLLVTLFFRPEVSYQTLARTCDMPIGTIGPTRRRALGRMRNRLEELGFDLAP